MGYFDEEQICKKLEQIHFGTKLDILELLTKVLHCGG